MISDLARRCKDPDGEGTSNVFSNDIWQRTPFAPLITALVHLIFDPDRGRVQARGLFVFRSNQILNRLVAFDRMRVGLGAS